MFWTFNCPQRSYQQLFPRTVQGEDRSGGQAVPTLDPLRDIMGSPPSSTPQASGTRGCQAAVPQDLLLGFRVLAFPARFWLPSACSAHRGI